MKILKILLILLVPAIGFVGCEKSQLKPGCGAGHEKTKSAEPISDDSQTKARMATSFEEAEPQATEVVGSGDDDRDGGDKKTKKIR